MSYSVEAVVKYMITQNNHNLNIAFPAVVVNTDKIKDGLVDVQPVINFMSPLTRETQEYPVIFNVSLVFPNTKSSTICFPVNQGDYVQLLIQSTDISKYVSGEEGTHDPLFLSYGNLSNVVAMVGFTPYQHSCFNPNNYKTDFSNQDLNIVHNKNTVNEVSFKLTNDGDVKVLNAKKVSYECEEFEINASKKISFASPLISENGR